MQKLYVAFCLFWRHQVFPSAFRAGMTFQRCAALAILFFLVQVTQVARAQQATLFEDFENVELGELPEGWSWYQQGGTDPTAHWVANQYPGFDTRYLTGGVELGDGEYDADWLITPQIPIVDGDYLIFDGRQDSWDSFGDRYQILISTTTPQAPAAFTNTLATYTEDDFPKNWQTLKLDLSAYAGQSIYIAFVHITTYLSQHEFDLPDAFNIDNLWIRPLQPASLHEALVEHEYGQAMTVAMTPLLPFIRVNLRVIGDYNTINVTSLTFSEHGTLDASHISEAILYYTGATSLISIGNPDGYSIFGSLTNIEGKLVFTGSQDLEVGDNFFWLAYTVDPGYEPAYPYPEVDASFDKVIVEGVEHAIDVPGHPGGRAIVPSVPVNDDIADAIPLSTTSARYGSSNAQATPEPDVETLAYCAPGGFEDGSNSIWWYFKAPGEGLITADLSATDFNTILVFYNKDYDQIACHDNINAPYGELQSKISEFPVTAGQEIYIRVTGYGDPNAGPQNAEQGVVILDFVFSTPLGNEGGAAERQTISSPYPNPARGKTSFDIMVHKPGEVTLHVNDVMGRPVLSKNMGFYSAGEKHTVELDVSTLPAGTYLVNTSGSHQQTTRKLIVVK
jgi:hypothetical protein